MGEDFFTGHNETFAIDLASDISHRLFPIKELEIGEIKFITNLPKQYIIKKNITILIWEDGSKTIVKKAKDDNYDKRLGFLTAYFQKNCGMSKNKANKYLSSLVESEEKPTKQKKKK